VTGASFNGSTLYAFGTTTGTNQFIVEKFNPTTGSNTGQYMYPADFPGLQTTSYDIAFSSEGVWVARDESDSPILRYNDSGQITGYVEGATISCAAGLTVDADGFLWVSDPDNDKIYKLDTSTSVADETTFGIGQVSLTPAVNPFTASVMINATGYSDGTTVEVFDLRGRLLETGTISGSSYFWDASEEAAGTYLIRVSDTVNTSVARLMKI